MDNISEEDKLVYLPEALVNAHMHLFPHCRAYHVKSVTYGTKGAGGIVAPAYGLFESSLSPLKEILEKAELEFRCVGTVDNGFGEQDPFWGVLRGAECTFSTTVNEDLQNALMGYAELLSTLTYRSVSISDRTDVGVFTPVSDSRLAYCIGQRPMGETTSVEASTLFGIGLTKTFDRKIEFVGPVLSRGEVFTDDEGVPVAQTIGGMTYIFAPTKQCNENEALAIVCMSIAASWNKTRVLVPQEDEATFSKEFEMVLGHIYMFYENARCFREKLEQLTEEIKDLESRLVGKIRLRENLISMQGGIESERSAFVKRSQEGLARIETLPEYHDIRFVKEGVEIRTKEIAILHDDVPYRIGRFVLRFNAVCEFSLWAEETHHHRGVMHPHIGRNGGICYGNVTVALQRKLAAFDIGGATEIVFRWLSDGYMHESADTKVTEWPVATEVVTQKVEEAVNESTVAA